ncbi:aldo/keto reductase [Pedobacter sp. WC2423]|uniref:aldo/keto reductase n=1 Tax=Pedobacter sp. WC2423 TaxID=3234142 RepID=UPI0034667A5F
MQATNKIVLGTVQFGLTYGINNTSGKPNQEKVNEILATAYDAGICYLDTAEAYGDAHQVIGEFHKTHPDQIFHIITKLPHNLEGDVDQKIEKYLVELNVSQLHAILFHSYRTYKENQHIIQLLNTYKKAGKIEYIGVSVYTNEQIEDVIEDDEIDLIQLPFNLFDNLNLREDTLKRARMKGKIVHTRSAFLQGLFFTSLQTANETALSLAAELEYIRELSKSYQVSLPKMALNYCLQQPDIDNVLIGVDNLEHLNQNILDADYSLSQNLLNDINTIIVKDVTLLNPSLWNR